jgi:hypothetical protein
MWTRCAHARMMEIRYSCVKMLSREETHCLKQKEKIRVGVSNQDSPDDNVAAR